MHHYTSMNILQQADRIHRLEFFIGGHGGPAFSLTLTPGQAEARAYWAEELPCPRPCELQHTPTRFKRLIRRIFRHYGVATWAENYELPGSMDGTHWELSLLRESPLPPLQFRGHNAYPPHFRKLLQLLKPYFHAQLLPFETDL